MPRKAVWQHLGQTVKGKWRWWWWGGPAKLPVFPSMNELAIHPPGVHSPGSILVGPWPPQTAGLIGCISRPTGLPLSAFVASVGSGSQLPLSAVTASVESGSQLPLSAVTASVGSGSHPPEGAPFAPFPFSFAVLRVPRCVQLWGVEAAASGFSAFRVLREPQEEPVWTGVLGLSKQPTGSRGWQSGGKEMAIHSSVLAWRIPGTGEPGMLQSMGSLRVGHD